MPNHASIHLIGHLGKDPESKYLSDGTHILKFSLCVNTGYKEKQVASWWECSYFGKASEAVSKFLSKGKAVLVQGEPTIRKWNTEIGKSGTSVDVRVASITLLGDGKRDQQQDAAPAKEPAHDEYTPAPAGQPAQGELDGSGDVPF